MKGASARERAVVALGFLTWGVSMLMRTSFGYFVDALSLSAAQVGTANALLAASVCLSAFFLGPAAARCGRLTLPIAGLLTLAASGVLALAYAPGFPVILLSRVLLGAGCGPLFTLIMKSAELSGPEAHYPRNAGFISSGEACINTILGPVILVFLLGQLGFRAANLLFVGLLLLLALCWLAAALRLPKAAPIQAHRMVLLLPLLKNGPLMLCLLAGALSLVACWCVYMYVPTLLQVYGGFSATRMSVLMTAMGCFMLLWMLVLPAWYARRGWRQLPAAGCLLGACGMLAPALFPASAAAAAAFVLLGGLASVMSLFFMAILSVERVASAQSADALALVNGGCELFGAALGPMAAGWIADRTSLPAAMLLAAGCMLLACVVSLILCRRPRGV